MAGNWLIDRMLPAGGPATLAIEAGETRLSYRELSGRVARWSTALMGLGVRPGVRVMAQVEKSLSNLLLYLATVRAGGVYVPLNTGYTIPELAYFIDDARPGLIVCEPAAEAQVEAVAGQSVVLALDPAGRGQMGLIANAQKAASPPAPRGANELAAICYTSGTTGRSKGAMLTHGALASNAETLRDLWRFTPADVLIHALPTYHVHGLFVATHVALMARAGILLHAKFDARAVIEAMPRATTFMGVPTHYTRLLADPGLTREAAACMRLFISGSAPLPSRTHEAWRERTGHAILERYGMTETGMNASNPYDGERRPGAVGFPLPGVALRIVGEAGGAPLPQGEVGSIEVKGPNVCAGYWRNAAKTAESFRPDGYFITGDLGSFDADGYLTIVGRDKDLIITGGLNVYPKEVEAEIDAIEGVVESAVIGLPHADFGEAVTAVVAVGEGGPGDLTEAGVIAALAPRLARFKQPKRVLFVADLPRNAMGKVQKASLRSEHGGLYA